MPEKTECPRCRKVGLVRAENVIKGGLTHRHFYCGFCHHSWAVTDDGKPRQNYGHAPERSRAADKG